MKIVYCIIDCSQTGGMERSVCGKANYLADVLGYDVSVITSDQGNKPNFYSFSDKIHFIDLGIHYDELKQYPFWKRMREQVKKRRMHQSKLSEALQKIKADIVISTYTHEFTLLPSIQDGSQKIAEIHFSKEYNKIANQSKKQSFLSKWFSILAEKRKYKFIDQYSKFVILTKNDQIHWKNHANIAQIYNMLPFSTGETATLDEKRVISVGRLAQEKGYDLLLEAWAIVSPDFPDWRLDIFGAGEEHEALSMLIEEKKLINSVRINSPSKDIQKEYLNSSICVMASRFEGFGMALIEAMSCGVPCISFDCPGPSEIITNKEDGILVPGGNTLQLAEAMKKILSDNNLRKEMGKKAKQSAKRYSQDNIMQDWNVLFKNTIHEKNSL
ncbi:glycosyl transferase [Bacteroidia bacterium]|nr:glycosyl transferase [Bacteroidia bacterium]